MEDTEEMEVSMIIEERDDALTARTAFPLFTAFKISFMGAVNTI